jgi:hypothetical protein
MLAVPSFSQNMISGIVKDDTGEPVIGASVVVKGNKSSGTVTDLDGKYVLKNVDKGATLIFSYIGYMNKEVQIGDRTNLNVTLSIDNKQLDEVVVVGYAVGTKRTVSGAVERVGQEDMNKGVVTSAADALKGKVSGVVISQSGGDPYGDYEHPYPGYCFSLWWK